MGHLIHASDLQINCAIPTLFQDPRLHFSAAVYLFPFSRRPRLFLYHVRGAAAFYSVGSLTLCASRDSFGNPRDKLTNAVTTCTHCCSCSHASCNNLCISLDCHGIGVTVRPLSRALSPGYHDSCDDEHLGGNACFGCVRWDVHGVGSTRAAIKIVRAGASELRECV